VTNPYNTTDAFVDGYVVEGANGPNTRGTNWSQSAATTSYVPSNNNNTQADAETVAAKPATSSALIESQTTREENDLIELAFKCQ
jgi:hypothetical protein